MNMISHICDEIGTAALMRALGVGRGAISNARVAGKFPARWYLVVRQECAERGIECSPSLFNFVEGGADDCGRADGGGVAA